MELPDTEGPPRPAVTSAEQRAFEDKHLEGKTSCGHRPRLKTEHINWFLWLWGYMKELFIPYARLVRKHWKEEKQTVKDLVDALWKIKNGIVRLLLRIGSFKTVLVLFLLGIAFVFILCIPQPVITTIIVDIFKAILFIINLVIKYIIDTIIFLIDKILDAICTILNFCLPLIGCLDLGGWACDLANDIRPIAQRTMEDTFPFVVPLENLQCGAYHSMWTYGNVLLDLTLFRWIREGIEDATGGNVFRILSIVISVAFFAFLAWYPVTKRRRYKHLQRHLEAFVSRPLRALDLHETLDHPHVEDRHAMRFYMSTFVNVDRRSMYRGIIVGLVLSLPVLAYAIATGTSNVAFDVVRLLLDLLGVGDVNWYCFAFCIGHFFLLLAFLDLVMIFVISFLYTILDLLEVAYHLSRLVLFLIVIPLFKYAYAHILLPLVRLVIRAYIYICLCRCTGLRYDPVYRPHERSHPIRLDLITAQVGEIRPEEIRQWREHPHPENQ